MLKKLLPRTYAASHLLLLLCFQFSLASSSFAQGGPHNDIVINYLDWDGKAMWAKLEGNSFRASRDGSGVPWDQVPISKTIRYKTWGGGNWEASLNNRVFTHAPDGDWGRSHTDTVIKYIAGDHSNWMAVVLDDKTFQHTPDGYVPRPPDWQAHSIWCTKDPGSSGRKYLEVCKHQDQYEAVLACQQDAELGHPNDRTSLTIISAGRDAVNSFMASRKPKDCNNPPQSAGAAQNFYVTGRYDCVYASDNSAAGDCTVTTNGPSCQLALDEQRKVVGGDACSSRCSVSKRQSGGVKWIHGGLCQGFPSQ